MTKPLKKWYKKDIKVLKNQIDTFCLQSSLYYSRDVLSHSLKKNLQEIVTVNLSAFRDHIAKRMQSAHDTAEHYKNVTWGSPEHRAEMVERFMSLEEDDRKAVTRMDQILAKIEAEGLPQEVVSYDGPYSSGDVE